MFHRTMVYTGKRERSPTEIMTRNKYIKNSNKINRLIVAAYAYMI